MLSEVGQGVSVTSPDGQQVLFCTLEPEDCFGELSFLDGRTCSSAAVETAEPVQVIALTRSSLDSVLDTHPAIAGPCWSTCATWCADCPSRPRTWSSWISRAGWPSAWMRLAEEQGTAEPDGIRLDLTLTQSDLAGMVGASRPSVNQALASFGRRGYLRMESRSIVITDRAGLRRRHQR